MNTLENNKLIAEFMGVSKGDNTRYDVEPFNLTEYKDVYDLKYDISWYWLMPVVEKIEGFTTDDGYHYNFEIENTFVLISRDGEELVEMYGDVLRNEPKISVVYKAVVEFIKWYNDNK